jgi:tetratricopeptide (TPR) repeat protein
MTRRYHFCCGSPGPWSGLYPCCWIFWILIFFLLSGGGCRRQPRPVSTPPASDYFRRGEVHFEAGDYAAAARFYELHLRHDPGAADRDDALFHLAMAYALPGSSVQDLGRARVLFEELTVVFPGSPQTAQAALILELLTQLEILKSDLSDTQRQVQQLREELERLKEIDMRRAP